MALNANNSSITMSALDNIYLDSIYGNNSFSLRSISGTTSLKMHNNMPQPIGVMGPQKPVQTITC